jgi:hypothetical protein
VDGDDAEATWPGEEPFPPPSRLARLARLAFRAYLAARAVARYVLALLHRRRLDQGDLARSLGRREARALAIMLYRVEEEELARQRGRTPRLVGRLARWRIPLVGVRRLSADRERVEVELKFGDGTAVRLGPAPRPEVEELDRSLDSGTVRLVDAWRHTAGVVLWFRTPDGPVGLRARDLVAR